MNATAAPSSVSNGSVTNQAIQIAPSGGFQYHYGPNQISCQGPTLAVTPFVTNSHSFTLPRRDYQRAPFYDPTDANDDGVPDNPGEILFWQQTPTGQKDSFNVSLGISATFSIPLDGGLTARCKALSDTQRQLMEQQLAMARLDYEIGRAKHCALLLTEHGVIFKPGTPAAQICSDVIVTVKPNQVLPHTHKIISPEPAAKPAAHGSDHAGPAAAHRR